jgi:uncharacterized protein (TIGR04551 family)
MRSRTPILSFALAFAIGWAVSPARAQLEEEEAVEEETVEGTEEEALEEEELPPEEEVEEEASEEEQEEGEDPNEFPDPDEAMEELRQGAAPSSDPTEGEWGAPQPTLTLHGYFRVRAELWDTFYLGRDRATATSVAGSEDPPFSRFRPLEDGRIPGGGCGSEPETGMPTVACDSSALGFGTMRLRLSPTLALSDDVRVHAQFDVFDNMVLGSTPDGSVWEPAPGGGFVRVDRVTRVPVDSYSGTQLPPSAYRNSLSDSIVARRAWAEVTNRGLGQLRFGRMGSHWGLGLLANGGDGIDGDYSTDVDRIMAITKIAGFHLVAAFDFASEGFIQQNLSDPLLYPYDPAQEDDVDQYVFAVARRMDEEEQEETLQRGGWVLNGGLYFVYRTQKLSTQGLGNPFRPGDLDSGIPTPGLVRREAEAFIPDLWVQFLWRSLRLEFEAALIGGAVENIENDSFTFDDYGLLQFGFAFEGEYRLLDDKLGIYFNAGFGTGDSNVEGLSTQSGLHLQNPPGSEGADNLSTFRFHPNYRVDLILWRNIMGQISGAYYFKPGLSYDFIRNSFGQLFGIRGDAIYSRASSPVQTWGNDANLGLELNATLYYRSEDGPELLDGFYGMLQYGILFPMAGLGYAEGTSGAAPPDLENAQIIRLLLGVEY